VRKEQVPEAAPVDKLRPGVEETPGKPAKEVEVRRVRVQPVVVALEDVDLVDWLDKVGIESVGKYYINVEGNFWVGAPGDGWGSEWNPYLKYESAFDVVRKFRLTIVPFAGESWLVSTEMGHCRIEEDVRIAICECVLDAIENGRLNIPSS
jgi:hypothetical protein